MEQGKHEKTKPRFIALRALGRSRVITATPFGWTFPLTNSSAAAAAIVAKPRREDDVLPKWRYWEWDLGPRKRKRVEDRFKSCDAPTRLRMFLSACEQECKRWWRTSHFSCPFCPEFTHQFTLASNSPTPIFFLSRIVLCKIL